MKTIPTHPTYYASDEGVILDANGTPLRSSLRNGYPACRINGKWEYVHRLVNLAFNGVPDKGMVTNHIDLDKTNSHPQNLEWISSRDNTLHYRRSTNKTSRFPGVSFNKQSWKWRAQVWINGIKKNLGYYKTEEEAYEVYMQSIDSEGSKYSLYSQEQ